MKRKHLAILVLVLFVLAGCAGAGKTVTPGTTPTTPPSDAAMAFSAVSKAFVGYDFGMTTLRELQKSGAITQAQFDSIKQRVAWPFYNAIVAADNAAHAYASAPPESKQSAQGKMTQALEAMAAGQKDFTELVNSLKGGK